MKKRTWLMLLASMMIPMTVCAQGTNAITWDFEDKSQLDDWTLVDKDGDGFNWEYFSNEGLETNRMTPHSGDGLMMSESYSNDNSRALNPDNWLISPEVTLGGTLAFWACGQDESYCDEIFAVYVSASSNVDGSVEVDGSYFVQVGTDKTATGKMTLYEFDLSPYARTTGRFAIRHYKTSDQFILNIDDVCLDVNAVYVPDPILPTNLTVVPTSNTADVAWNGTDGNSWNLRYRAYSPNETQYLLWDLTVDNYTQQTEGWTVADKDGDGNNWEFAYSSFDPTGQLDNSENVCFTSASFEQGIGELDPDNWLLTPELQLGGTFKFWAQNDNYEDVLGVYVVVGETEHKIGDDITPGQEWTEYSFDTSAYDGQVGNIAIVHHNTNDGFRVYVDYISYYREGDTPADWIEVNGLTTPNYQITGLTASKEYMVQVQASTEKGESNWTAPVNFTTQEPSDEWEGSGTEADPYLITNVLQMQKMATLMNNLTNPEHFAGAYFVLKNDLDFSSTTFTTLGTGTGIKYYFSGTFDGRGHSISGVTFNSGTSGRRGIFGVVRNGGTVKNLTLKSSTIGGGDATGGIVGRLMFDCLVENCHVESSVTINGKNYAGGVVGFNLSGTIRACSSAVTVSGSNYIGGIVGACQPASTVENCFYYGGSIEGSDVGAIVGKEVALTSDTSLPLGTSLDLSYSGNLYYTTASIKGVNGSDVDGAEHGYKVTTGTDGLTLKYNDGSIGRYDNDHVTKIGDGLYYKDVYYGKAGGSVNIVGSVPTGTITKLETTAGTLTGSFNSYKLTFAEADAVITATVADAATDVTLYDKADNTSTISDNDEKLANVTLSGRKFYKDGYWNTLCLPFDFVLEGSPLEDATIKVLDGGKSSFDNTTGTLTLSFTDYTETVLAAGTPCIVKWDAESSSEVEDPAFNGVVIKNTEPATTNSIDDAVTFKGNYSCLTTTGSNNTLLYLGANNKLYWPSKDMTIGAFRAYFQLNGITAGEPSDGVRSFVLNFGDDSTQGVTTPLSNRRGAGDEAFYTLDGRRLSGKPSHAGVYINNGMKIVIK